MWCKIKKIQPLELSFSFCLQLTYFVQSQEYSFTIKIQPEKRKARALPVQIEKKNTRIKMVLIQWSFCILSTPRQRIDIYIIINIIIKKKYDLYKMILNINLIFVGIIERFAKVELLS